MAIPQRNAVPAAIIAANRTSSTWGKRGFLQSSRAAELFIATLCDYPFRRCRLMYLRIRPSSAFTSFGLHPLTLTPNLWRLIPDP